MQAMDDPTSNKEVSRLQATDIPTSNKEDRTEVSAARKNELPLRQAHLSKSHLSCVLESRTAGEHPMQASKTDALTKERPTPISSGLKCNHTMQTHCCANLRVKGSRMPTPC